MKTIDVYPNGVPRSFIYAGPMFARTAETAREYMDEGISFAVCDLGIIDESRISEYDQVLVHNVTVNLMDGTWQA